MNSDTAQSAPRILSPAPILKKFLALQILLVLACAACEAFAKYVLRLDGAFIYPLKTPNQTAWDFTLFAEQFSHFHHPEFFLVREFPYPAPVAIPYAIFFSYSYPLRFFYTFILASFALAGLMLALALRRRGVSTLQAAVFVVISLILSYPLWFELKQGNIEICVWVVVVLGVWAFCKGKGYTAAACFGIAGSMKLFPFVYLGLLLARRMYRELVVATLAAVSSTLIALWLLGPNILNTWRQLESGVEVFRTTYLLHLRSEEIGFDHSLFGVYKRFMHHLAPPGRLGHIADAYLAVAAVCGIALYILIIRHLPLINQVLCLTVASILLPPISFDYTLMHLYIPWAMLVLFAQDEWQVRQQVPGLTAAFVCFAILFAPESEFIRHGIHCGGQVKALTLLTLLIVGLKHPFATKAAATPQTA
jgi:Glycosyltransferase family 87